MDDVATPKKINVFFNVYPSTEDVPGAPLNVWVHAWPGELAEVEVSLRADYSMHTSLRLPGKVARDVGQAIVKAYGVIEETDDPLSERLPSLRPYCDMTREQLAEFQEEAKRVGDHWKVKFLDEYILDTFSSEELQSHTRCLGLVEHVIGSYEARGDEQQQAVIAIIGEFHQRIESALAEIRERDDD